ncbi:adipocyte plasma membrane-associated protein hemomucin [Anticarsia gemmatalis]|uniref:adipocyte plasma membrane-associated protein hemomucin n=1 Tax=Anticarsia gemmatalis TaxID=129554 RepID=UPI003F76645A
MGFIINFIKRIIKLAVKLSLYLAVFATIIVLIPNLPPYTKFTSIEIAPVQPRVGPLAPNDLLNNAEKRYKGKLLGPEAFQLLNGELYTSLATGEIVKISPGGHVTFVTKVGQPCTGLSKEHICGRPLGFQIDDSGKTLYVADAYHGIWKVDLKSDKKQLLVSPRVEIEKRQPKLFNSIALAKNGDFYWTDSSSDFNLKDGAISILTDPSGRVFHYNAAKNESKVLIDDLWFANSLVLSPNHDFLVVTETCRYRILKHYLAGPKKGNTEVLIDGLPGIPDNVRVLPDGSGILVGLYTVFDDEQPLLTRSMSTTPVVRKFLARLQRLIEIPFEYLNTLYPHIVFEEIVYHIGHFKSVSGITPTLSGLLQADWNGNIIASYYNTDNSLGHISDAIVYNDKLYTGSPHVQDFIGAVPVPPLLKKAFESAKKTETPKVETKPPPAKPVEAVKPKVEEKPKVEKPKVVQEKPKVEQKPKVEEKPKPKVEEAPKVQTKPKTEEKKEAPKVVKPPQAKPVENAKPVEKKQPTTTTPPPPKTTQPPAKTEPAKKAQEQPKPTTTPKPAAKTTPPPKPTEKTTSSPPKTTQTPDKPKKAEKPVKQEKPKASQGQNKEQIPIKEDIPSDTAKPTKDTLKVIKKGGVPTEIPVPNN